MRPPSCKHTDHALKIIDQFAAEHFTMEDGLLVIGVLLAAATADEPTDIAHRVINDITETAHARVASARFIPMPKGRA